MQKRFASAFFWASLRAAWLTALLLSNGGWALAQQGQPEQQSRPAAPANSFTGKQPPRASAPSSNRNDEMKDGASALAAPVDLPDVPSYSGRCRYTGGVMFSDLPGGPAYILHYAVREPSEQVLEWYKNALPGYGWKLKRMAKHSLGAVSAHGHHIDVHVRKLADGQGTDLELTFRLNEGALR